MVANVTSLTGNGLKDWLVQRVTAVYFAAYSFFIIGYLLMHPQLSFAQWHTLFSNNLFRIASLIALFALSLHAWIGIWTVTTDYMKCTALRLSVQMLVVLWLLSQFIWGLMILWGQ
ncbi:succinate dehydrogenase, hydrophobic membrane anchor protein [Legionella wadsworthii]|uniref:Succinate dehydrogenase hydrophobic membrane anchor subunit n=1 Tax=Legionella wadsworthii TaxID=28088 RepID=A0A378LMM0_9GAMM|nr:succinate dehydrogenase, hydrophobic membrane anchor protein [Legionella wadsworthii]STY28156.1 succinate dehydrogenase, hydrophobic membrane anchor protein [Legionella wadsworthii]